MAHGPEPDATDLFIIGGGVNGCGIARDAAGRGLSVALAEMGDLASGTSSASTKLFHGGLRYLEYFELRLVREALMEREVLLKAMPHISWPLRFVLPWHPDMRLEASTPVSRLVSALLPWTRGRRPGWMIRAGLMLYDRIGGRSLLPPTRSLDLPGSPEGAPLAPRFRTAYEYSDCWVDDSRLVALTARDASDRGARIMTRTQVVATSAEGGIWHIATRDTETGTARHHRARTLVNAAGPWVGRVIANLPEVEGTPATGRDAIPAAGNESASQCGPVGSGDGSDDRPDDRSAHPASDGVRLVRGSHIVTRRLYDHDKCYVFQGSDGRIVFTIPYEADFTLIGTTDAEHGSPETAPVCTPEERRYLLSFVNRYLATPVDEADIVWSFSGVRALHDDGHANASATTRDYRLAIDDAAGAPVLNVFGGKITTFRRLAESAVRMLGPHLSAPPAAPWTRAAALPGGDFPVTGVAALLADVQARHPYLTPDWARRLVRAYGTDARLILAGATTAADLGRDFGATLTAREVTWLIDREFARTAEDVVWRRSKLGLRMSAAEIAALDAWMTAARTAGPTGPVADGSAGDPSGRNAGQTSGAAPEGETSRPGAPATAAAASPATERERR